MGTFSPRCLHRTLLLHPAVVRLQQEMTGVEVSICLFCGGEQGEELEAGPETHPQLWVGFFSPGWEFLGP